MLSLIKLKPIQFGLFFQKNERIILLIIINNYDYLKTLDLVSIFTKKLL